MNITRSLSCFRGQTLLLRCLIWYVYIMAPRYMFDYLHVCTLSIVVILLSSKFHVSHTCCSVIELGCNCCNVLPCWQNLTKSGQRSAVRLLHLVRFKCLQIALSSAAEHDRSASHFIVKCQKGMSLTTTSSCTYQMMPSGH